MAEEEWLSFVWAVGRVSQYRKAIWDEAESQLRVAIERDGLRTDIDHELEAAIKQSQQDRELYKSLGTTRADIAGAGLAESGSGLDILRESAAEGALAYQLVQYPRVNKADLEKWLSEQTPERQLKPAPEDTIKATVHAVYDDAEKAKAKPPNTKELVKPVQRKLKPQGYRASGRQIQSIGKAKEFANRRGVPGKRFT